MNKYRSHYIQEVQLLIVQTIRVKPNKDAIKDKQKAVKSKKQIPMRQMIFATVKRKAIKKVHNMK